jgi:hypothetical protein
MPFGKAKKTVAQDVQALDHVRADLLALRGEVTTLRLESNRTESRLTTEKVGLTKRLSAMTDLAHEAMQKATNLQHSNECLQDKLDLANSSRYLTVGNQTPVCLGCNGDQEIAYGPCGHIVFCSACAARHMSKLCPICGVNIQTSLRVYRV